MEYFNHNFIYIFCGDTSLYWQGYVCWQ